MLKLRQSILCLETVTMSKTVSEHFSRVKITDMNKLYDIVRSTIKHKGWDSTQDIIDNRWIDRKIDRWMNGY